MSSEHTEIESSLRPIDKDLIKANVAFPYALLNKEGKELLPANKVIGSKVIETLNEEAEIFAQRPNEKITIDSSLVMEIPFEEVKSGAQYPFDLLDPDGYVIQKAENKLTHNFVYGYKYLDRVLFTPTFEKIDTEKFILKEVLFDELKIGNAYAMDLVSEQGYIIFPRFRSIPDVKYVAFRFFQKLYIPLPTQKIIEETGYLYKISSSLFMQGIALNFDIVDEEGRLILTKSKSLSQEDINLLALLKNVYIVLHPVNLQDTKFPDNAKTMLMQMVDDSSNDVVLTLYPLRELGLNVLNEISKIYGAGTEELLSALHKCCLNHYKHSVNLAMMTLALILNMKGELGLQYNDDREYNRKAAQFFMGALLHDIGMIKLPKELMSKSTSEFSKEDKLLFSSHAQKGYEILQRFDRVKNSTDYGGGAFSDITKQCVLFHHERYDDKGYPTRLPYDGLPITAKWISVLEIFDVLMQNSKRGGNDLNKVSDSLKGLVNASGTILDLTMVSQFITKVGIRFMHGLPFYREGDYVVLDSGDLCTVVTPSLSFPLAPTVQVIVNNNGKKVQRKSLVDLRKDTRMIMKFLAPSRVDQYIKKVEAQGFLNS